MVIARISGIWGIFFISIIICLMSFPAEAKYSGGTGEQNNPYKIATAEDLILLGETPEDYDKNFILINNIDLDPNLPGGRIFSKAVIAFDSNPFTGVFDGNDHIISNLTIEGTSYLGLFGRLDFANILNLGMESVDVNGTGNYIGGIVGQNHGGIYYGTGIFNCYSTGSVSGHARVGGIAGRNSCYVTQCFSTSIINGDYYIGGIVGFNRGGTVDDCYSMSTVNGNKDSIGGLIGWQQGGTVYQCYSNSVVIGAGFHTGGLIGYNSIGEWGSKSDVIDCYSSSTVTGNDHVGGLIGLSSLSANVNNCHSTGATSGIDSVGGLIGVNGGSVNNCYSTGTTDGIDWVGGLIGSNSGSINNCYNTGAVDGRYDIAGLVGRLFDGIINQCYSTGAVNGNNYIGGVLGRNYNNYTDATTGTVTSSFWDIETSGIDISNGGTGLTTTQMQNESTFTDAGWDFVGETANGPNDIWKMWEWYDYPHLTFEPGPNTPLVFVDINDPNFLGQMSRYEVTNDQYCDFLNEALASGDIMVNGFIVEGANGLNIGEDYVGQSYYKLDGSGYTGVGAIDGGAARIYYFEGTFIVDSGFGNHPVTYVNWYGVMAFANYYGYYLPTEEQWQAVADYDGTYIYGCGETIDPDIVNYRNSVHPDGTMFVGILGLYGYGMSDMAGNVWEWTSSGSEISRIFRGGGWYSNESDCAVSTRGDGIPYVNYCDIGFRVFR